MTEIIKTDGEEKHDIPAEGNNIAVHKDRAFADMPSGNGQPPVEKTFRSPPDAATKPVPPIP